MRVSWIKWTLIPLAAAGLLAFIEPKVADAEDNQAAGPGPTRALQSPLNWVYCSSPENCLAISSSFAATSSDGGHSWVSHRINHADRSFDTYFDGLACATPDICMAIGQYRDVASNRKGETETPRAAIARTSDGGHTWTPAAPLPKSVGPILNVISCPTRSFCLLAGESSNGRAGYALVTTNLGRSWRRLKIPKGNVLPGVTCETPRFCVAVAEGTFDHILTTNNGGSTWRRSSDLIRGPPETISSPTCIGFTRCLIVGWSYQEENLPPVASIIQTTDGGRTTTNDVLPPNTAVLSQISCASAAVCVAAGGGWNHAGGSGPPNLLTTSDGGATWVPRSLPASIIDINSISCPSVTSCMMVGSEGPNTFVQHPQATVAVSDDGGATWTVEWPMPSQ
jgi:photosystem II stability/assembly factor-like uncharacterized protein